MGSARAARLTRTLSRDVLPAPDAPMTAVTREYSSTPLQSVRMALVQLPLPRLFTWGVQARCGKVWASWLNGGGLGGREGFCNCGG